MGRGARCKADLSPHVGSAIDMRIRCPMLGHAERFAKPLTLGGSNTDDNVQLLCPTCNIRKGSTHPSEYEARIGYQQPAQAAFR